jgi:hypothetical protein
MAIAKQNNHPNHHIKGSAACFTAKKYISTITKTEATKE